MSASRPGSDAKKAAERRAGRPVAALAAAFAVVALAAVLWRGGGAPPVVRELHVFGSLATIEVVADPARAAGALDAIERRLALRHREWHPWEPSALTALNAAIARGTPHRAPPSLRALIEAARPLVESSDGLFDPGAGALVALWGFHTSDYPVRTPEPAARDVAAWRAARPSLHDVVVVGEFVGAANPRVQLDFNAIAEGMATREIAAELASHGIADALVALGGDVHALGRRGDRAWRVALRDPGGGVLASVELGDGESLYASGGDQRWREGVAGRAPHVLDPRTGRPAAGALASAVLARDPVLADAAATALLVAGPARWRAIAARMGVDCALVIDDAGTVHATRAFAARLSWRASRTLDVAGPGGACGSSEARGLRHNGGPEPDAAQPR